MLKKQTILQNQKTINYLCGEWLLVNEKKNDINCGPKWKPIRGWPHQHFVKLL